MAENVLGILDAVEGARNCVLGYAGVKKGENVLIVTDTAADFRVAGAFAIASREAGAEVSVSLMSPREIPNTGEPPRPIAEAMRSADVIFDCTSTLIIYTRAICGQRSRC